MKLLISHLFAAALLTSGSSAATFDFALTGTTSTNNSTGPAGNVNVADASVTTITPVIDGVGLTLTAVSTTGAATIGANSQGFGVSTNAETGTTATRIESSKGESLRISFNTAVTLDSMRFGNFATGEVVTVALVSGSNPFTSGTSLTIHGNGSQGPSTDVPLLNNPIVTGGIGTIAAGTVLAITISGGTNDVLLNEFTVSKADTGGTPVTIIPSIPSPNVTANPNPGTNLGTATVSAGNAVGQSFSLPAPAHVTGFVFESDGVAMPGSFSLKLVSAMDGKPWMPTPVATVLANTTASLADGNLFKVELDTPVDLKRGSYIVTLEGAGSTAFSLARTNAALYPTGQAARNDNTEGWVPLSPAASDFIFAVLGTAQNPAPAPTGKPNIVFILADDLGWTDVQCGSTGPNVLNGTNHGSGFYQTPNIARLAAQGMSFTSAYMSPNCAPSRAALLSGQYSPRLGNGVYAVTDLNRGGSSTTYLGPSQNEDIPAAHRITPEALQDGGYVTAHLGKYHLTGHETGIETAPENQGFDYNFGGGSAGSTSSYFATGGVWNSNIGPGLAAYAAPYTQAYVNTNLKGPASDPLNARAMTLSGIYPNAATNNPDTLVGTPKHLDDAVGDAATAFIRDHVTGSMAARPFYMQVHFFAPHSPIQPRPDLQTKYNSVPTTPNHTSRAYAALVEGLDQNIGRIMDRLDDPNGDGDKSDTIAANTLVIFLSDNGGQEPTQNHPLRHKKGSFYSGGIRVPLIVRQPGSIPAATQSNTLVHAVDYLPTLLGRAGLGLPAGIHYDGVSFAEHLTDPVAHPRSRPPIYYHFPGYLDTRARPCDVTISRINGEDYKLIYTYDMAYTGNPTSQEDITEGLAVLGDPWELYNLDRDISETSDLLDGRYSNWLLYGSLAVPMADSLISWLNQPGADWNASKLSVRATGAVVGLPTSGPAAVSVPFGEQIYITAFARNEITGQINLIWNSENGFHYEILAGSSPDGPWTAIGSTTATGPQTTRVANDPPAITGARRFYRVRLTSGP
jgi:arylsulfatase A-like enzyme